MPPNPLENAWIRHSLHGANFTPCKYPHFSQNILNQPEMNPRYATGQTFSSDFCYKTLKRQTLHFRWRVIKNQCNVVVYPLLPACWGSPFPLFHGVSPSASPASHLSGLLRRRDPSTKPRADSVVCICGQLKRCVYSMFVNATMGAEW